MSRVRISSPASTLLHCCRNEIGSVYYLPPFVWPSDHALRAMMEKKQLPFLDSAADAFAISVAALQDFAKSCYPRPHRMARSAPR